MSDKGWNYLRSIVGIMVIFGGFSYAVFILGRSEWMFALGVLLYIIANKDYS